MVGPMVYYYKDKGIDGEGKNFPGLREGIRSGIGPVG